MFPLGSAPTRDRLAGLLRLLTKRGVLTSESNASRLTPGLFPERRG
jgi:hypothetical protein